GRELLGGLLDVVDDVVDRAGEGEDVLAVERGHLALAQAVDDLVGHAIALVLALADRLTKAAIVGPGGHQVVDLLSADARVPAGYAEELEDLGLEAWRRRPPSVAATSGAGGRRASSAPQLPTRRRQPVTGAVEGWEASSNSWKSPVTTKAVCSP